MGNMGSSGEARELRKQLAILRSEAASHAAELAQWRQKYVLTDTLLSAICTGRAWKLARKLRAARRFLLPRRIDVDNLIPWQQLEAKAGQPNTWISQREDAAFLISCLLEPGWVQIDVRLASDTAGLVRLFTDNGGELTPLAVIPLEPGSGAAERRLFAYFNTPVRALRLEPLTARGEFRLERLRVTPLPRLVTGWHAVRVKLHRLFTTRGLLKAVGSGLSVLLRGDLHAFKDKLLRDLRGSSQSAAPALPAVDPYTRWLQQRQLTEGMREVMRRECAAWPDPPLISVLVPVYNIPERLLRLAIESVLRQIYPHWELCLADDRSTEPHVRRVLEEYARRDSRIKVVYRLQNGNISAATNSALAVAQGEFVALLDQDDELAEQALFRMAQSIVTDRDVDMLYSDEDKLEMDGRHVDPFFKPIWSPEYFLACMYTCHLGVYRTEMVRAIDGFRSEFDSAQDYDLVLRLMAGGARIRHVPEVLYHWRKVPQSCAASEDAKPEAHDRARRALRSYLAEIGRPGTVEPDPGLPHFNRVRFALPGKPKVSIIMASACRPVTVRGEPTYYARKCIGSIVEKSTYENHEIILISNRGVPEELDQQLRGWGVKIIHNPVPFNWSAVQNLGVANSTGEFLLFLNDDMEVITPDWLESMMEFAQIPEVGAVGAKLLYPDGRLQHAGVIIANGNPTHAFYGFPSEHRGYYYNTVLHRNVLGVTGACLMTRRDVFDDIGGFDVAFPLEFNDVDFCLKVICSGRRIVYMPYAELYHFESSTRREGLPLSLPRFHDRWKGRFGRDPYINPNLSHYTLDYRLAGTEAA